MKIKFKITKKKIALTAAVLLVVAFFFRFELLSGTIKKQAFKEISKILKVDVVSGELSGEILGDIYFVGLKFNPHNDSFFTGPVVMKKVGAKFSLWGLATKDPGWLKEVVMEGASIPVDGRKLEKFYNDISTPQGPSAGGAGMKIPVVKISGVDIHAVYDDLTLKVEGINLTLNAPKGLISAILETRKISFQLPGFADDIELTKTTVNQKPDIMFIVQLLANYKNLAVETNINIDMNKLKDKGIIAFDAKSAALGGESSIAGELCINEPQYLNLNVKFKNLAIPRLYTMGYEINNVSGEFNVAFPEFKKENLVIKGAMEIAGPVDIEGIKVDFIRAEKISFNPGTMDAALKISAKAFGGDASYEGKVNLEKLSADGKIKAVMPDIYALRQFFDGREIHCAVGVDADFKGSFSSGVADFEAKANYEAKKLFFGGCRFEYVNGDAVVSGSLDTSGKETRNKVIIKTNLNAGNPEYQDYRCTYAKASIVSEFQFKGLSFTSIDRMEGSAAFHAGNLNWLEYNCGDVKGTCELEADDITGDLAAALNRVSVRTKFTAENLNYREYQCARVDNDIELVKGKLYIREINGVVKEGSEDGFSCSGVFDIGNQNLEIIASGNVADLSAAKSTVKEIFGEKQIGGSVEVYATLGGNVKQGVDSFKVSAVVSAKDLLWDKYRLDDLKGQLTASTGEIAVDDFEFTIGQIKGAIKGKSNFKGEGEGEIAVHAENTKQLEVIAAEMFGIKGITAEGRAELGANIKRTSAGGGNISGAAVISFSDGIAGFDKLLLNVTSFKGECVFDNGKIDLKTSLTSGNAFASVAGVVVLKGIFDNSPLEDSALNLHIETSGIDAEFAGRYVKLPEGYNFRISSKVDVQGTLLKPDFACEYEVDNIAIKFEEQVEQLKPLFGKVSYKDGFIELQPLEIDSRLAKVKVEGKLPYVLSANPEKLKGLIEGKEVLLVADVWDLDSEIVKAKLDFLKDNVKEIIVEPRIHFELSGTTNMARAAGRIEIKNGRCVVNDKTPVLEAVNVTVAFNSEASFDNLANGLADVLAEAQVNFLLGKEPVYVDGTVKIPSGFIETLDTGQIRFDISARSERALFVSEYLIRVRAGFSLDVAGTLKDALVKGDVNVDTFRYEVPMDAGGASAPESGVKKRSKKPIPVVMHFVPPVPGMEGIKYDIAVKGPNNLFLNNDFFTGTAGCELRILGNAAVPEIQGKAWLKEGVIKIPTADFNVEHCEINFPGGTELPPTVNMAAKGKIGLVQVTIRVNGTIFDPVPILSSDPFYSQEDLLSLLAVGVVKPRTPGSGTVISSTQFTNWVGNKIMKPLPGGKQLAEVVEKINFEYEFKAGRSEPVIRAEYPLSTRFSMYGERDEYGNFNFDLQYIFRLRF